MEVPPLQARPSHLWPVEELPPPPEEAVGFPEKEASTGMGTGLEGLWVVPGDPRGANVGFQAGIGRAGTQLIVQGWAL